MVLANESKVVEDTVHANSNGYVGFLSHVCLGHSSMHEFLTRLGLR